MWTPRMCTQQCLRRHVPQVQHTHKDSVEGQGGREAEKERDANCFLLNSRPCCHCHCRYHQYHKHCYCCHCHCCERW